TVYKFFVDLKQKPNYSKSCKHFPDSIHNAFFCNRVQKINILQSIQQKCRQPLFLYENHNND
ncbi:hypothetical protein, partial [Legionella pneumophila]|uniref:hypothetical protein n=1 Tax=Legionella pneumophila TaxID=446 RepID=UPI001E55AEA6